MGWICRFTTAARDNNGYMFEKLGADTGFDCINNYAPSAQMADFLNALSTNNDSKDHPVLLNQMIMLPSEPLSAVSRKNSRQVQQGSMVVQRPQDGHDRADDIPGQLRMPGQLHRHADRLQKLLSYTRHEYFRRISAIRLETGGKRRVSGRYEGAGEIVKGIFTIILKCTDLSWMK